jgi:hypothetical protein
MADDLSYRAGTALSEAEKYLLKKAPRLVPGVAPIANVSENAEPALLGARNFARGLVGRSPVQIAGQEQRFPQGPVTPEGPGAAMPETPAPAVPLAAPVSTQQQPAPPTGVAESDNTAGTFGRRGSVAGLGANAPAPATTTPGVVQLRGGYSGPASAGAPAAESPILKQYANLQQQKANDLALQRSGLANEFLARAMISQGLGGNQTPGALMAGRAAGAIGSNLARTDVLPTLAANERVAANEAAARKNAALIGLEGTKLTAEAHKYGAEKGLEGHKYTAEQSSAAARSKALADYLQNLPKMQRQQYENKVLEEMGPEAGFRAIHGKQDETKVTPLPGDLEGRVIVNRAGKLSATSAKQLEAEGKQSDTLSQVQGALQGKPAGTTFAAADGKVYIVGPNGKITTK